MKIQLLLLVILLPTFLIAQNTIRVSNDPAIGDYDNLQTAINNASTGDVIYVYPGSYGNIIVDKKLKIIGTGYLKSSNPTLNITTDLHDSKVGQVDFCPVVMTQRL